jgi:hypothetical protein
MAIKAASAVPTKGASLIYSAGSAAVRGVVRTVSGGAAKVATASATPASSTPTASKPSGTAATTIASRIPSSGAGGKGGPSTT